MGTESAFLLHDRLAADTVELAAWPLCLVRLMNDRTYPWLVLVPARPGLADFHDVAPGDRPALMAEIDRASRALQAIHAPDKLNVAALGNMVPQLHVHVIARFRDDPAWPGPVWGAGPPVPYAEAELAATCAALRRMLAENR